MAETSPSVEVTVIVLTDNERMEIAHHLRTAAALYERFADDLRADDHSPLKASVRELMANQMAQQGVDARDWAVKFENTSKVTLRGSNELIEEHFPATDRTEDQPEKHTQG